MRWLLENKTGVIRVRLKIGETIAENFQVAAEMIEQFAELSGDRQRLHTDEVFAGKTIFKKRIAHGLLILSFVSKLLGMEIADLDEYLIFSRLANVEFLAPVFAGDTIYLSLTLREQIKNRLIFDAVWRTDGVNVLKAEAILVIKRVIKRTEDKKDG